MTTLGANSTNRQSAERSAAQTIRAIELSLPDPLVPALPIVGRSLNERIPHMKKALRGKELHRIEWLCEQQAQRQHFDCCTRAAWNEWRITYDALGDEDRNDYLALADASKSLVLASVGQVL